MKRQWEISQVINGSKQIIQADSLTDIFCHLMAAGFNPLNPVGPLMSEWGKKINGALHSIARPIETINLGGSANE